MAVEPQGSRANSWEDVADLSARAGIVLDSWQELILQYSMGERSDGTWAAKRVGVSVPRQNGKSQLLVARALAGVLLFGELKIVISAHQADTARETFGKFMEIYDADGNQWLRDRVRPNGIMSAINRESIKFVNGASIQFKARTMSGGRGFSSDCLLLDEAQRLRRAAWVSINSTMSAMPNPQVWLLGTPPTPDDDGDVFGSIRQSAIDGVSSAAAWLEWSAERDDDPRDELTRWKANPAWNTRINHEVVQGEFESYTPEEFAQDRLGIWRNVSLDGTTRLISQADWDAAAVDVVPDGVPSFGVAFSYDGLRMSVAGAIKHDDGVFVELVGQFSGPVATGVSDLADWLAERADRVAEIGISGAAGSLLVDALADRGVSRRLVRVFTAADYFAACAGFEAGIREVSVTHSAIDGQAALDNSVAVCDRKLRGNSGAWGWKSTSPEGDETPIEAASVAVRAARITRRTPGRKSKVVVV